MKSNKKIKIKKTLESNGIKWSTKIHTFSGTEEENTIKAKSETE